MEYVSDSTKFETEDKRSSAAAKRVSAYFEKIKVWEQNRQETEESDSE